MIRIHGAPLSPFVRKTLLTLEYKGIAYELNPVFPGSSDPAFRKMSPLGKIPVLEEGDFYVSDSSVICRYVDSLSADKSIYPTNARLEARALWIEEYADTKLMEGCGGLFFQRMMSPRFLNKPTDEAAVKNILDNVMPETLSYIESILPESGGPVVGDAISIADISIITCLIQAQYGEFEVSGETYPKIRAYFDGALANEIIQSRLNAEKQMLAA